MRQLAALFLLAGLLAVAPSAIAQEAPSLNTISVSATDTVRVTPDRAIVRFAIMTQDRDAEAARRENELVAQRVLNAVRERGIPERHIQVRMLQLRAVRQGRGAREEFVARRDVEVIVDELVVLPAVVARVVQEGAVDFRGVAYDLRDRTARENEAIQRAARRAREKADLIAATLGASIARLHSVAETTATSPRPPDQLFALRAMEEVVVATHEAFAPGEIEVRASMDVVFVLE